LELAQWTAPDVARGIALADSVDAVGDADAIDEEVFLPIGGSGLVESGDLFVGSDADLAEHADGLGRHPFAAGDVADHIRPQARTSDIFFKAKPQQRASTPR
jgi:hypothetical protein